MTCFAKILFLVVYGDRPLVYLQQRGLRVASRRVSRILDSAVAGCGLTAEQLELLDRISTMHKPTRSRLAERMVASRPALSQSLRPLVKAGYVLSGTTDSHSKHGDGLELSDIGKSKLMEGMSLWANAQTRLDKVLGAATSRRLRSTLQWVSSQDFEDAYTIAK